MISREARNPPSICYNTRVVNLEDLPSWAIPALASLAAVTLLVWATVYLRRRFRQGREELEKARNEARSHQTGREPSMGPLTPDPEAGPDLQQPGPDTHPGC